MKPISWKEAAELTGIFAILASLIFVALQLQQEEKLLQSEMRAAMVSNFVAVNNSIIENADIWVRGNKGEKLDQAESAIHAKLVANMNDHMFQLHQTFLVTEPESEEQVLAMFAGFLLDNPGAYQAWIDAMESRITLLKRADQPQDKE